MCLICLQGKRIEVSVGIECNIENLFTTNFASTLEYAYMVKIPSGLVSCDNANYEG